jgi:hypothetical protein
MVRTKMTAHMIGDHKTTGGKSPIRFLQMYAPKSKKSKKKGMSLQKYILQFDMKDRPDRRWRVG